jgi:hypothetical protein
VSVLCRGLMATEIRLRNGWIIRQMPASVLRKFAASNSPLPAFFSVLRMFALGATHRNYGEEDCAVS